MKSLDLGYSERFLSGPLSPRDAEESRGNQRDGPQNRQMDCRVLVDERGRARQRLHQGRAHQHGQDRTAPASNSGAPEHDGGDAHQRVVDSGGRRTDADLPGNCLLYTSDAADDMQCVYLGGRRIIKKKIF